MTHVAVKNGNLDGALRKFKQKVARDGIPSAIKKREAYDKPGIRRALVELDGAPFKYFEAHRNEWAENTCYLYPGAIQYYGPAEVCDLTTRTLALEKGVKID